MADTEKKTGIGARMQSFYFEIKDPEGNVKTIQDTGKQTGPEIEPKPSK